MLQVSQQHVQHRTGVVQLLLLLLATYIIINCHYDSASAAPVAQQKSRPADVDDGDNDESQLILVIDAGSGKNRAILFNVTIHSEYDIVVTEKIKMISESPLAQFIDDHFDESGPQKLMEFLHESVFKKYPSAATCSTKLVLGATAGVRMLPADTRKSLLANTLKALKQVNPYLKSHSVRAIDGKEEAMLTGLSAHHITGRLNQLLNDTISEAALNSDMNEVGSSGRTDESSSSRRFLPIVEVGGASVQVAVPLMEPHEDTQMARIGSRILAPLRLYSWLSVGSKATLAQFAATAGFSQRHLPSYTPCIAAGVMTKIRFRGRTMQLIGDNATADEDRFEICKLRAAEFVLERNIQRVHGLHPNSTVLVVGSLHFLVKHTSHFICEKAGSDEAECDKDRAYKVGVMLHDLEENAKRMCSLAEYSNKWDSRYCILLSVQTALLRQIGLSDTATLIAVDKAAWPRGMAIRTAAAAVSL